MQRRLQIVILIALLALGAVITSAQESYQVRFGDTLGRIAAQFNVSLVDLAKINNIANANLIFSGETLTLVGDPAAVPAEYVVRYGDTLSQIAARYGTTTSALALLNSLANPNHILVGQRLKLQ